MRVTPDIIRYIENLRAQGKTYKEIISVTGLSKGTLSLYLKGKPSGNAKVQKSITLEMQHKIRQLRYLNKTQKQIADELNLSQSTVQRYTSDIKIQIKEKAIKASSPFEGYLLYGPYYCPSAKRNKVIIKDKVNDKEVQMTWTRYLMCVKENRILGTEEHVDHIDDNSLNDDLDNLQILNENDHAKKTLVDKSVTKTIVTIQCPECGELFDRAKNHTYLINKRFMRTFCSRSCAARYYKKSERIDPQETIKAILEIPVNV